MKTDTTKMQGLSYHFVLLITLSYTGSRTKFIYEATLFLTF